MARPPGFKKLTRNARHLIRVLRRSKHATVQDAAIGSLRHEINRKWYRRSRAAGAQGSKDPGHWRPLTHRAKGIMSQLRKARSLPVQRRLVDALQREVERGRRVAEKIRKAQLVKAARRKARQAVKKFRAARRRGDFKLSWHPRAVRAGRVIRKHAGRVRRTAPSRAGRAITARSPQVAPPPQGRLAPGSRVRSTLNSAREGATRISPPGTERTPAAGRLAPGSRPVTHSGPGTRNISGAAIGRNAGTAQPARTPAPPRVPAGRSGPVNNGVQNIGSGRVNMVNSPTGPGATVRTTRLPAMPKRART